MSNSNLAVDYDMSDLEEGKPSSPSKNAKMEATEEPPVSNNDKPDDPSDPRIVEIIKKELSSLLEQKLSNISNSLGKRSRTQDSEEDQGNKASWSQEDKVTQYNPHTHACFGFCGGVVELSVNLTLKSSIKIKNIFRDLCLELGFSNIAEGNLKPVTQEAMEEYIRFFKTFMHILIRQQVLNIGGVKDKVKKVGVNLNVPVIR